MLQWACFLILDALPERMRSNEASGNCSFTSSKGCHIFLRQGSHCTATVPVGWAPRLFDQGKEIFREVCGNAAICQEHFVVAVAYAKRVVVGLVFHVTQESLQPCLITRVRNRKDQQKRHRVKNNATRRRKEKDGQRQRQPPAYKEVGIAANLIYETKWSLLFTKY